MAEMLDTYVVNQQEFAPRQLNKAYFEALFPRDREDAPTAALVNAQALAGALTPPCSANSCSFHEMML